MKKQLILILRLTFVLLVPSSLSACTTYSTGFNCPDSKGMRCVMLSEIDQKVDNGEIETIYMDKKCKNAKCQQGANVPKQALNKPYKVKLEAIKEEKSDYQDGENLYLK